MFGTKRQAGRIEYLEKKLDERETQLRHMHRRAQKAEAAMAKLLKTMAPYINPPNNPYWYEDLT